MCRCQGRSQDRRATDTFAATDCDRRAADLHAGTYRDPHRDADTNTGTDGHAYEYTGTDRYTCTR